MAGGATLAASKAPQRRKQLIVKLPYKPRKFSADFSQSQAALALAIVKSKPEGLSIEEYCNLMRKNIRSGRGVPDAHRYVDTREFWKDAYSKLHAENKTLEEKVRRLGEQRIVHNAVQQFYSNGGPDQRDSNHRHTQLPDVYEDEGGDIDLDEAPAPRGAVHNPRKRHALWLDAIDVLGGEGEDVDPLGKDFLTMNAHILQMAQQRDALDILAQAEPSTRTVEDLVNHTVQLIDLLIAKVLPYCSDSFMVTKTQEDPETVLLLRKSFHQVKLSFCCCFRALDSLCQNIAGRNRRFQLIERLVKFFEVTLMQLRTVSNAQARHELRSNDLDPRHTRATVEKVDGRVENGDGDYIISQCLSKLLASILLAMELKAGQIGHSDVLEGILYHILTESGHIVSEITFKPPTTPSNPPTASQITQLATYLEARHLMQVLHAALGGINPIRKDLVGMVLEDKPFDFSMRAMKKLQATLMKSIVGDRCGQNFRESLKLPEVSENVLSTIETPEIQDFSPEWVINTVWSLVGCDLVLI